MSTRSTRSRTWWTSASCASLTGRTGSRGYLCWRRFGRSPGTARGVPPRRRDEAAARSLVRPGGQGDERADERRAPDGGAGPAVARIEEDVRSALKWCLRPLSEVGQERTACGLDLVREMTSYWYHLGYAAEGRGWLSRALEVAEANDTEETADTLHGLALLQLQQGDVGTRRRRLRTGARADPPAGRRVEGGAGAEQPWSGAAGARRRQPEPSGCSSECQISRTIGTTSSERARLCRTSPCC